MKTGNRKCWKVTNTAGRRLFGSDQTFYTQAKAEELASRVYDGQAVLEGYKLVPCSGEAHNPAVGGMIDNCMCCAPRWGWVMVPDGSVTFWSTLLGEAIKAMWQGPEAGFQGELYHEMQKLESACLRRAV